VTALDVVDLVVIAGHVLGIQPSTALGQADLRAAETALAAAPAPPVLPDSYAAASACAGLMRGLLRHPPFPQHRERIAVAAGLQFLAVNGWQADLEPPEAAALAVQCLASGRIEPGDVAVWLAVRLSAISGRRIRMPRVSSEESVARSALGPLRPWRLRDGAVMSVNGRMLARFSDHAAAAVFMARQEARRLGHGSVDPEHLLLGLIRVGTGTGLSALDRLDVNRDALRQRLEESTGHSPGQPYGPVRFSRPRGQMVLVSALTEALAHDTTAICTADLLLAQYHDDGPVSQALAGLGATEDRVRSTVVIPPARTKKPA
jgi:ATP-dependent Clp protease ATP-binding subunit ClpC